VRHLGGGPIEWYASGGLSGWSYEVESGPELRSVSSIRSRSMRTVRRRGKETEVFDLGLFEKNCARRRPKATTRCRP
jgi:hypothetical protein